MGENKSLNMSNSSGANLSFKIEESEHLDPDDIYPKLYCAVLGIIMFVGVFGNCLTIVIFSAKKNRQQSFSVYIRALAVTDSLVLVNTLIDDIIFRLVDATILEGNKFRQAAWIYLQMIVWVLSSILLICIAVDRYIAIVFPLKRARLCTYTRARWTVVGVIVFATCVCLPLPIFTIADKVNFFPDGNKPEHYDGPESDEVVFDPDQYRLVHDLIFVLLLPFVTVTSLNMHLLWTLNSSFRSSQSIKSTPRTPVSLVRITVPLITVMVSSMLTLLPMNVVQCVEFISYLIHGHSEEQKDYMDSVWDITSAIALVNYAMNFYVLVVSTKSHRETLKNALRCGKI